MTDDCDEDGDMVAPRREFDPEIDSEWAYKADNGTIRWISGGCLSGNHIQPGPSASGQP